MLVYYEPNQKLYLQIENASSQLDMLLNSQEIKLQTLLECLKNINDIIQSNEDLDSLNRLIHQLKNLKTHLNNLRNNISNLKDLKKVLADLANNLPDNSNIENVDFLAKLDSYNESCQKIQKEIYDTTLKVDNFIYQYISTSEFIVESTLDENNNFDDNETHNTQDIKEAEMYLADDSTISDNKVLLISELQNKVFLPYTVDELQKQLKENKKYSNLKEIIENEYTIPFERYKNSIISRFKEAYNLMRKKEHSSITDSLNLALELSFNSLLNPAIITACKNLDELDIYLDYLSTNELDKFNLFEIKYEILPK